MENKKYASIIFDDGPREPMREMIDKFIKSGYKCGFAIIGNKITDQTEDVLKYAIDNGFELVSHGQNHVGLPDLEEEEIIAELFAPIKEIKKRFDYEITMARAPYLWLDEVVSKIGCEKNLPFLGHGITMAHDWDDSVTAEEIYTTFNKGITDGAIVTLHVKVNTCAALDKMFEFLKEQNFELVTPSELFKIKNINPIPLGRQINYV